MPKLSNDKLNIWIILSLVILTLAVFWQVKDNEFTNYDDNLYVTENPRVQAGLTFENVTWAFTAFHAGNWHPLTWLSHMLDCQLFGLKPGWHHLINLLFHIVNTLLLFLVLHRMTRACWQSAFVAAIFALHPLHVETVAWASERKDVLSALFWMLTMGTYLFYVERPGLMLYLLIIFFFALGLMAKPMLVTLPFVLLLLDYWPLQRYQPAGPRLPNSGSNVPKDKRSRLKKKPSQGIEGGKSLRLLFRWPSIRPLILEKIPFLALSAISSAATIYAQNKGGALSSIRALPADVRIENALISYAHYIAKTVWPQNLAVLYPYTDVLPLWEVLLAGLLLLCITGVAVHHMKQAPYLIVGWLWFLGTLVPVIGLLQVGIQAYADRYTYIPLIGLFMILAWGIADISTKWRYRKIILISACSLIFLSLLVQARIQVGYWQNSITLFEHTVRITDRNYLAHNNLGIALRSTGKIDEAVSHYQESIRIRPNYEQAHYNLGNALMAQKKMDDAVFQYREAIRIKPNYAIAHLNLGTVLISQGKPQEALIHFREALKWDPENAGLHYNMALTLVMVGQNDEAINHFQEALRINQGFAEAHNELGRLLAIQGKREEAIAHFREALWLKPNFTIAKKNLEMALAAGKGRR